MTVAAAISAIRRASPRLAPPDAISTAEADIRRAVAARKSAERELAQAQRLEESARAQLGLVEAAQLRAREASDADAVDRQKRAQAGKPGSDPALTEALERAQNTLRDAQRAEDAAREVLPELEARAREAEDEIKHADSSIDSAVWRLRVAQLASELPRVREAASVLIDFRRRMAVLGDVGRRGRLHGTPVGSVPEELLSAAKIPEGFSELELSPLIRVEIDRLRRMRGEARD